MSETTAAPLSGIRVVDLTQFLSGPYCTQILGDLGAEVIKIEPPQGDLARNIPPHFVEGESVYYLAVNRNKKSVVVNLKEDGGRDVLRKIMLTSDIVVENFRPGVLARLGLPADELRSEKPGLIWCSISGFGQDGPYRDKPAYDMIVQALSGGMSLTGERGRGAVRAGIPLGDLSAGMYAVIGILAALRRRDATGRGDVIDVSMLDCQAAMLTYQAAYHMHSGEVPDRQGTGHDSIPTYRSFKAGDGREVVVTAITERMWEGMCRALGVEELATDDRFRTNRERFANRDELWPLLDAAFLEKGADEWVAALEAEEVPIGVVNTLDRVVDDPQIRHRGMVLGLSRNGASADVMGDPVHFSESRRKAHGFPPGLGEDTEEILGALLGLSAEDVGRLVAAGAVGTKKT